MRMLARTVLLLMLALLILAPATAEAQKKKQSRGRAFHPEVEAIFQLPDELELTAKQQRQIENLRKHHGPRLQQVSIHLRQLHFASQQGNRQSQSLQAARQGNFGGMWGGVNVPGIGMPGVTTALRMAQRQQDQQVRAFASAQTARMAALQNQAQTMIADVYEKIQNVLTEEQLETLREIYEEQEKQAQKQQQSSN